MSANAFYLFNPLTPTRRQGLLHWAILRVPLAVRGSYSGQVCACHLQSGGPKLGNSAHPTSRQGLQHWAIFRAWTLESAHFISYEDNTICNSFNILPVHALKLAKCISPLREYPAALRVHCTFPSDTLRVHCTFPSDTLRVHCTLPSDTSPRTLYFAIWHPPRTLYFPIWHLFAYTVLFHLAPCRIRVTLYSLVMPLTESWFINNLLLC